MWVATPTIRQSSKDFANPCPSNKEFISYREKRGEFNGVSTGSWRGG